MYSHVVHVPILIYLLLHSLPLLQRRLAGGILSGGSGFARMVSRRFPQVGGGEGIILKSIRDLDFDGSVSFEGGTTGGST